jgi:hypothetical protein
LTTLSSQTNPTNDPNISILKASFFLIRFGAAVPKDGDFYNGKIEEAVRKLATLDGGRGCFSSLSRSRWEPDMARALSSAANDEHEP